jgi:dUTP pyrophosphatase
MVAKIKKLEHFDNNYKLPFYATEGSAGMDMCAMIEKEIVIKPTEINIIPTGLSIELPNGYEAQIRPRSGLAIKNGVTVLNSPGTIDSDYRGEIKIILINIGKSDFVIKKGDRIAQMVINKFEKVEWELSEELEETKRGEGGFGHTGKE